MQEQRNTGRKPVKERFMSHVRPVESGCWEWTASRHVKGYGWFKFEGKITTAQRVSWRLFHGEIPPGISVLHRCDNPPCVNPEHLFLGTPAENTADMIAKGRQAFGPRHPNTKLSFTQVEEIRRLWATGSMTQREIGRQFGVSPSRVSSIVRREARLYA